MTPPQPGGTADIPCSVVLVRPRTAANVGAVARVMANTGLARLALVDPKFDLADPRARLPATHAGHILDAAAVTADLGEALADCVLVAATSARTGGQFRGQSAGTPDEVMPRLVDACRAGPVALVFGPERTGLDNVEVARCHYLVHIPTSPAHPALNLSHAVAICLYELRKAWLRAATPDTPAPAVAPFAAQEFMFGRLRAALEEMHFLYGPKADSLMHALRHLIGRAGPSPTEVDVLLGLARQIEWLCRRPGGTQP